MDAKRQRRAVKSGIERGSARLVWQTEDIAGRMIFAQEATEQWTTEADAMDDVSLAQTLYDAIAASATGCIVVTISPEGHLIIQHSVDAEAMDN